MGGDPEKMMLSTIICAHNEEYGIGKLLDNLSEQRVPSEIEDHEILIVASGCTDRTVPIVKKYMTQNQKIKLFEEKERKGKASALNKALKEARGDILVYLPADVQPLDDGLFYLILPLETLK